MIGNAGVTLTAKEFETIHNTLCELDTNGINCSEAASKIREALAGAYAQDLEAYHVKNDHYSRIKEDLGLNTIWSIYEVDNLSDRHPFVGATKVMYDNSNDYYSTGKVRVPVNGLTWAALYVAADTAIRDSGDNHHCFIEGFEQVGDTLILVTGS